MRSDNRYNSHKQKFFESLIIFERKGILKLQSLRTPGIDYKTLSAIYLLIIKF